MAPMKVFDLDDDGAAEDSKVEINEEFARIYDHNKRREELQRYEVLKRKGLINDSHSDSDSDSGSESSDDSAVDGCVNKDRRKEDIEYFDKLSKVRNRDPCLYDKEKLFDSERDSDGDGEELRTNLNKRKKKPKYLKDVQAKHLMEEGPDFTEIDLSMNNMTYVEEQEEIKKAVLEATQSPERDAGDDGSDDFFKLKERNDVTDEHGNEEEEEEEYRKKLGDYFGNDEELDDNNRFLKNYFMKQMWMEKDNDDNINDDDEVGDLMRDEEEIEKQEKYEEEFYKFRHEEEEAGDRVMGYSRITDDSVRKSSNTRRVQRQRKAERMKIAEMRRTEELRHMKNLKKADMKEKMKKVMKVAGITDPNGVELDLGDFDAEEFDKKMKNMFDDKYYDGEPGGEQKGKTKSELITMVENAKQEMMEDYHRLDYEDAIGGDLKTRFKYAKVQPNRYGLNSQEIFLMNDGELNQYVSMKKLVPYKEKEWRVPYNKRTQFKKSCKELLAGKNKKMKKNGDGQSRTSPLAQKSEGDLDSAGTGKFSKNASRKRRRAELKLSESRLKAYGKIVPSSSKKSKKR